MKTASEPATLELTGPSPKPKGAIDLADRVKLEGCVYISYKRSAMLIAQEQQKVKEETIDCPNATESRKGDKKAIELTHDQDSQTRQQDYSDQASECSRALCGPGPGLSYVQRCEPHQCKYACPRLKG